MPTIKMTKCTLDTGTAIIAPGQTADVDATLADYLINRGYGIAVTATAVTASAASSAAPVEESKGKKKKAV